MEKVHVSNTAMEYAPEAKLVHAMYEDRGTKSRTIARKRLAWLDRLYPGKFVLITTGDFIYASCQHTACATYDAYYGLYIIETKEWEQCKEAVLRVDAAWKKECVDRQCQKLVG